MLIWKGGVKMKIGITERGDAGIDFSWVEKLYDANVIISKSLSDKLIANLVENKEKIKPKMEQF